MTILEQPLLDAPPLQRFGLPELVYGVSPAAATDFVAEMPGQYFTRILSVFCRLMTDATVADREVVVEYRNANNDRFALAGAAATVPASSTVDYFFSAFLTTDIFTVDGSVLAPLPPILLMPTFDFRIHVVSAQAADQLSRIRFEREQFFTTGQPIQAA